MNHVTITPFCNKYHSSCAQFKRETVKLRFLDSLWLYRALSEDARDAHDMSLLLASQMMPSSTGISASIINVA